MKKLLPLVAVLAATVTGCLVDGRGALPTTAEKDIKPVPLTDFKPATTTTPIVRQVSDKDITPENAKEMSKQLQSELDREQMMPAGE